MISMGIMMWWEYNGYIAKQYDLWYCHVLSQIGGTPQEKLIPVVNMRIYRGIWGSGFLDNPMGIFMDGSTYHRTCHSCPQSVIWFIMLYPIWFLSCLQKYRNIIYIYIYIYIFYIFYNYIIISLYIMVDCYIYILYIIYCVHIYIYAFICIYIYMHIYIYICIYIYYTYIHKWFNYIYNHIYIIHNW